MNSLAAADQLRAADACGGASPGVAWSDNPLRASVRVGPASGNTPHPVALSGQTDEEIAAEEIGGEDLAVIHGDDWRHIVRIPGLASLILDRIERGGLGAVNELLTRYDAGQAWEPTLLRVLELRPRAS